MVWPGRGGYELRSGAEGFAVFPGFCISFIITEVVAAISLRFVKKITKNKLKENKPSNWTVTKEENP